MIAAFSRGSRRSSSLDCSCSMKCKDTIYTRILQMAGGLFVVIAALWAHLEPTLGEALNLVRL